MRAAVAPSAGATQSRPVGVVVVDDSRVFLDAVCFTLARSEAIAVLGQARDADTARYLVARTQPQVVVVDLRMPGTCGIELTRILSREHPAVKVVALTISRNDEDLSAVLRAGACAYVLKSSVREELPRAILAAAADESWLTPCMASKLIASYLDSASMTVRESLDEDPLDLTPRERAVLASVAQGKTNRQIAEQLFIAETTVKTHLKSIFAKLDVTNRSEAAAAAWRLSLEVAPADGSGSRSQSS